MLTHARFAAGTRLLSLASSCAAALSTTPSAASAAVAEANARAAAHLAQLRLRKQSPGPPAPQGERLCLLDGTNIAYRAYYGMPKTLATKDGRPTNAVLGFCNQLLWLQSEFPGYRMLAVFDTPAETFRADLLPEYKANRPAAPDSLRSQLASIREACAAFGVPHVAEAGLEADDLIATAAVLACERAAADVVIVSTDKDFLQLVSDDGAEGAAAEAAESGGGGGGAGAGGGGGGGAGTRVHVYDHKKKLRLDAAFVRAKYGVPPRQFADFLALTGDSSDNVPGVPTVGPKTAAKLLQEHGGLEALLAAAAQMKASKRRKALIDHADDARRGLQLVTLPPHTPRIAELRAARADELCGALPPPPPEQPLLREFLARHELRSLERRLFPATAKAARPPPLS